MIQINRRAFLKGAGVVTIVAVAGKVLKAAAIEPGVVEDQPAFEAWKNWREVRTGPLSLVRAAILAASAVNTQPWIFKVTESSIELYADYRRNSGAFDPYLRELHISLGCALENLMLAASAEGYTATAALAPGNLTASTGDVQSVSIARIELSPGKPQSNELYDAIPNRHTNRAPFDASKPIPSAFTDALGALKESDNVKLFLFTKESQRAKIVEIISKASGALVSDPQVLQDELLWIRDSAGIQKYRDGIARESLGLAAAGRQVKEAYPQILATARLFGLIAVRDRYTREQNLAAGRIWQRAHLLATARGLAGRPANQSVELIDQQRAHHQQPTESATLAGLTGDAAWQPTFMFYIGYPTEKAGLSARRAIKDVLM